MRKIQVLRVVALLFVFAAACSEGGGAPGGSKADAEEEGVAADGLGTDVCVRSCSDRECGPDGCGGSCGECAAGATCDAGKCTVEAECKEGEPCDDADSCTWGDVCKKHVCAGEQYQCDDGKECTTDTCDGKGECVFEISQDACYINGVCLAEGDLRPGNACMECVPSSSQIAWTADDSNPCDDGDPCTGGEYCSSGQCMEGDEEFSCGDDNPCTKDGCVADVGCEYAPLEGECDDGDACTSGDDCASGACEGDVVDCNDDNPCTKDSCDNAQGCVYDLLTIECDDQSVCTLGDECQDGVCTPGDESLDCDDGNACTMDWCEPQVGCINEATAGGCDDGNACTLGDACTQGKCKPGTQPLVCDDWNTCTTDVCYPQLGCVFAPNKLPCDDDDACTVGDLCADGLCSKGPMALSCDDKDPCTDDTCNALAGCMHSFNVAPCNDGSECTEADTCSLGKCVGQKKNCDDKNPCTANTCQPGVPGGCVYLPNDADCSDNDACTLGDGCMDGKCASGSGVLYCDDGNACTSDSCVPLAGCTYLPIDGPCEDGNPCTTGDVCTGAKCVPGNGWKSCDDGNLCTSDSCNPAAGCQHTANTLPCEDGNKCTLPDKCADGKCVPGVKEPNCDDDNACTVDSCDPLLGCLNQPSDLPCDDGSVCTVSDKCKDGQCSPGSPLSCDDGLTCTSDWCDPATGCVNIFNESSCDDKSECTINDKCSFGTCKGTPRVCDDGNVCTNDSCKPDLPGGCVHAANDKPCDDADPCTLGDTCSLGKCVSGLGKLVCNDNNPCTGDVCTPKKGCEHPPLDKACDDAEICTAGDKCVNGKCAAGQWFCECKVKVDCAGKEDGDLCNGTLKCDVSNPDPAKWQCVVDQATIVKCDTTGNTACKESQCQPGTGKCEFVAVNDGGLCNDGSVCTTVDKCAKGSCVGVESMSCDDTNQCTKDSCHPTNGCVNANVPDGTGCGQKLVCEKGQCVPCTPVCQSKECGDDGCGGSCGECLAGYQCEADGKCFKECDSCAPWQTCVKTVCQNPPSMGACYYGNMLSEDCHGLTAKGCCAGTDGRDRYYCGDASDCPGIYEKCLCYQKCSSSYVCSYDSWYAEFQCEYPPAKKDPAGNLYCDWWSCVPNCTGKECGDDGCGGKCGTCPADFTCASGKCNWIGLTSCPGTGSPAYSSCQGITYEGCCDGKGRLLYCYGSKLYCIDCAADSPYCGWLASEGYYDCSTNGGSDPSGWFPKSCTACVPPCPVGYKCVSATCVKQ